MSDLGRPPKEYFAVKVHDGSIRQDDVDLVLRFLYEEAGREGHAEHTILSNSRYLGHLVQHLPDATTWSNAQIDAYVLQARKQKANTARKRILGLKRFCDWLVRENLNTKLDIAKIKVIRVPAADRMTKTASQMLSTGETDAIIAAGKNVRDRCMLAMLAESGMRPFELLGLRWGDLKIDEYGCVINVSGKTEVPRFIRLIHAAPYVAAWRNDHPAPVDSSYIFTALRAPDADKRVTHAALKKIVRLAAAKSGVKKKVFPYLLRHSNVTRMLEEGYSDSTIRMVHWGNQSTSMLSTYGHVSSAAIDAELLDKAGIVQREKKERKKVHQCNECRTILKPGDEFCPKCGKPQSEEARNKVQSEEERLFVLFKKFMSSHG